MNIEKLYDLQIFKGKEIGTNLDKERIYVFAPKQEIYRLQVLLHLAGVHYSKPNNFDGDGNCEISFVIYSDSSPVKKLIRSKIKPFGAA